MPSSNFTGFANAAEQLDAYLTFWRDAGVTCGYSESTSDWRITRENESEGSKSVPQIEAKPIRITNVVKDSPFFAKTSNAPESEDKVSAPSPHLSDDIDLPDNFERLPEWWQKSDALTMASGLGPRISPYLVKHPKLLIISDMPEPDDVEVLFTGAGGKILDNIVAHLDMDASKVAKLSIWPQNSLAPDMEMDRKTHWQKVAHHCIQLIAPEALMLCGKLANIVITDTDLAENRRSLPNVNHLAENMATCATFHPRTLLVRPMMKKVAWKDWLVLKGILRA